MLVKLADSILATARPAHLLICLCVRRADETRQLAGCSEAMYAKVSILLLMIADSWQVAWKQCMPSCLYHKHLLLYQCKTRIQHHAWAHLSLAGILLQHNHVGASNLLQSQALGKA